MESLLYIYNYLLKLLLEYKGLVISSMSDNVQTRGEIYISCLQLRNHCFGYSSHIFKIEEHAHTAG